MIFTLSNIASFNKINYQSKCYLFDQSKAVYTMITEMSITSKVLIIFNKENVD